MIQRIKKSVAHQGIGGKEFKVDEYVTKTLTPNEVSKKGIEEGNYACWNFMDRREDFTIEFPHKLYYVKVDGIGYIIAQDEIENTLEPHEDLNNIKFDPDDINGPGGIGDGGAGAGAMACATPELKHNIEINPIKDFQEELLKNIGKMSTEDITKSINSGFMQGGGR